METCAIDRQPFHLVEHGRVRDVGVPPVHAPRADDAHGRPLRLHRPDLHGRGVGAEQRVLAQIEGVLHVAGGMVAGKVQRLEVVIVVLDLRPLGHREAQPHEDGDDLVVDDREGVQRALDRAAPRQREVVPAPRALLRRSASFGSRSAGSRPALPARAWPRWRRRPPEAALARASCPGSAAACERSLPPEVADADLLQLGRRPRAGDRRAGLVRDRIDARVRHAASRLWLWRSRRAWRRRRDRRRPARPGSCGPAGCRPS